MAAKEKPKQKEGARAAAADREKSLRAAVERQLSAAGESVARLLQRRRRPSWGGRQLGLGLRLRRVVMDAVAAAAHAIWDDYQAVVAAAGAEAEPPSHNGSPVPDGDSGCFGAGGRLMTLAKEGEPAERSACGAELRLPPQTPRRSGDTFASVPARETQRAGESAFPCRPGANGWSRKRKNPLSGAGADGRAPTAPASPQPDRADDDKVQTQGERGPRRAGRPGRSLQGRLPDGPRRRLEDPPRLHGRLEDGGPKCERAGGRLRDRAAEERSQDAGQEHVEDGVGDGVGDAVGDGVGDGVEKRRPKRIARTSAPDGRAGDRPFMCEFCGKTFAEKAALKRHLKRHTGGRAHACDQCGKTFTMSQHLRVHQRIHTGEKPYACRACGKRFRQAGNLDAHAKIHTGEKAFVCSLCGKRFRQKISLETHERFHREDKVFGCRACGKSFVQKADLKRHTLTHSGEKPHACRVCHKRYREKRSLRAHMKVHVAHDDERGGQTQHCRKRKEHISIDVMCKHDN